MQPHLKYLNPYRENENWYKGNLHTRCAEHSGSTSIPLKLLLNKYTETRHDFIAITDHGHLTKVPDSLRPEKILVIPGLEFGETRHLQLIGIDQLATDDPREAIQYTLAQNGLVILNHPNWQQPPHWTADAILEQEQFDGIEIFNGIVDRLVGWSRATDVWDQVLSRGRRCWGYAVDGSHDLFDINRAWVWVQAKKSESGLILSSLKQGSFYASTGVKLTEIRLMANKIHLETAEETAFRFIGPGGKILDTHLGTLAEYWLQGWEDYVRVEGWNRSGWFWTQPFWGV